MISKFNKTNNRLWADQIVRLLTLIDLDAFQTTDAVSAAGDPTTLDKWKPKYEKKVKYCKEYESENNP